MRPFLPSLGYLGSFPRSASSFPFLLFVTLSLVPLALSPYPSPVCRISRFNI